MPFHNPFGVLSGMGTGTQADADSRAEQPPATNEATDAKSETTRPPKGPARAVIRIERAGRGGKGVTVIEHLQLGPAQLADWLKQLKAALGCGGVIEGDALVLQGDQRPRLPGLLTARGVKKITVG